MNRIEFGDCRAIMTDWAHAGIRVQTCVTSPPYYGLRDYGTARWDGGDAACDHVERMNRNDGDRKDSNGFAGNNNRDGHADMGKRQYRDICAKCGARRIDEQLGLERTPDDYVANMVEVFRCVRDILADDGTLWLNLGDSYAGAGGGGVYGASERRMMRPQSARIQQHDIKPKDLIGIPWRVAFALQADGWYLRSDIIWHKPNPMPESVTDRPTKAHEYLFLLSKSPRYYFDGEAMKEEAVSKKGRGPIGRGHQGSAKAVGCNGRQPQQDHSGWLGGDGATRNRRSVWTITTRSYKGAHFATFPPALIEPCILAGSRPGDIVLDPFMGSGTTAMVAIQHGRRYLGCELNPEYATLQAERLELVK